MRNKDGPPAHLGVELELLGQGREAETFAWEEGRVLRLLRDPSRRDRLERGAGALPRKVRSGCLALLAARVGEWIEAEIPRLLALLGREPGSVS